MRIRQWFFIVLIIMFALCNCSSALAQLLVPKFADFWYTTISDIIDIDSCCQSDYAYKNKLQGTASEVANKVLEDVPQHTDCTWSVAKLRELRPSLRPMDFIGGADEWKKLVDSGTNIIVQTWMRECISKQGSVVDSKNVDIYPSYSICPVNSRYGIDRDLFIERKQPLGCSTMPIVCDYDVIGRDFQSPIKDNVMEELSGHLGLTGYGELTTEEGDIAEIAKISEEQLVNPAQIIKRNLFESFATPVNKYWGAKYGTSSLPYLSIYKAAIMQDEVRKQRGRDPAFPCDAAKYVLFSIDKGAWHPCQYDQKLGIRIGAWRCDYFVYNTYLAAGIEIGSHFDPRSPFGPRNIFDSLLYQRLETLNPLTTKVEDAEGVSGNFGQHLQQKQKEYSSYSDKQLQTAIINTLDNYSSNNAENLLPLTETFIYNENIPRLERLDFTWSLLGRYGNNSDINKRYVVLDILQDLYPIELTDELIKYFYAEKNKENRARTLWLLTEIAAGVSEEKNNYDFSALKNINIPKIRNFFYDELMHEKDISILQAVISLYETKGIASKEQAIEDVHKVFARTDINGAGLRDVLYSDTIKMLSRITDLKDSNVRQRYLKLYVDYMNADSTRRARLRNAIPPLLAPAVNRVVNIDDKHVDVVLQQTFLDILIANEPKDDMQDIIKHIKNGAFVISMLEQYRYIYDWLYAYNTLQSQTYNEANQKVAKAILLTENLYLKYFLLCCANKDVIDNIATKDLLSMYNDIGKQVITSNIITSRERPEESNEKKNLKIFEQFVYLKIQNILKERGAKSQPKIKFQ